MRVYFTQYGYVWSCSVKRAIEICGLAINEEPFNYDELCKLLKKRCNGDPGSGWLAILPQSHWPLDWEKKDWEMLKEELEDVLTRKNSSKQT